MAAMTADSDNLPAILLTEPAAPIPALIAARGATPAAASSNSSPPTSATQTPARLTTGRPRNFSIGATRPGSGCSTLNRYTSPPGSRASAVIFRRPRQASAGRRAHAVRLAGGGPGSGCQSRRRRARPQICGPGRQDAGIGASEARQLLDSINTQPWSGFVIEADRLNGFYLRSHQRGAWDDCRRRFLAASAFMGTPT